MRPSHFTIQNNPNEVRILLLNLFTPLSESKPTPKPGTLSLKIPAGVNYDDSPMELSIKYSKAKS
jgi:hypothetical protein